jgi:hypothetical protein
VDSPHVAELDGSVRVEAVIATVQWVSVVGWTALHHRCVVAVLSKEGFLELAHAQSPVLDLVITSHKQLNFLRGWEHTDSRQTVSEVVDSDVAEVALIEDLERVRQVEVGLKGQRHLVGLKLALELDEVTEARHELVFFTDVKDGLAGW